jgi:hypothetical protein
MKSRNIRRKFDDAFIAAVAADLRAGMMINDVLRKHHIGWPKLKVVRDLLGIDDGRRRPQ